VKAIRTPTVALFGILGLLIAGGGLRPRIAAAKGPTQDIWLAGGDLPHAVKIPRQELENPGARYGESFEGHVYTAGEQLGPGYDILVGTDLAQSLGNVLTERLAGECCETYYPNGSGPGVVEYWRPLTQQYSTRAEDREATNWEQASGGLYDLIQRYVAIAKAGLIGERPTLGEAVSASIRLLGARAFIDGRPLAPQDGERLAISLGSLQPWEFDLHGKNFGVLRTVQIGFGPHSGGLLYVYAPPGLLDSPGFLLPQVGPELYVDPAPAGTDHPSMAAAYQTTSDLDALLATHDVTSTDVAGQSGRTNGAQIVGSHDRSQTLAVALAAAAGIAASGASLLALRRVARRLKPRA
jgi:hypothetical protein